MTFSVTPYGIQAHIPVFSYNSIVYADLYWCYIDRNGIAPTQWICLRLKEDRTPLWPSACHTTYIVDDDRRTQRFRNFKRLTSPSGEIDAVTFSLRMGKDWIKTLHLSLTWKTVLIRDRPDPRLLPGEFIQNDIAQSILGDPMRFSFNASFRFDDNSAQEFVRDCRACGVKVDNSTSLDSSGRISHRETAYIFSTRYYRGHLAIRVGRCCQPEITDSAVRNSWAEQTTAAVGPVWATVHWKKFHDRNASYAKIEEEMQEWIKTFPAKGQHSCGDDHVPLWTERLDSMRPEDSPKEHPEDLEMAQPEDFEMIARVQGQTQRGLSNVQNQDYPTFQKTLRVSRFGTVTLSFTPCPINPMKTLIMKAAWVSHYCSEVSMLRVMA